MGLASSAIGTLVERSTRFTMPSRAWHAGSSRYPGPTSMTSGTELATKPWLLRSHRALLQHRAQPVLGHSSHAAACHAGMGRKVRQRWRSTKLPCNLSNAFATGTRQRDLLTLSEVKVPPGELRGGRREIGWEAYRRIVGTSDCQQPAIRQRLRLRPSKRSLGSTASSDSDGSLTMLRSLDSRDLAGAASPTAYQSLNRSWGPNMIDLVRSTSRCGPHAYCSMAPRYQHV